eukprot:PITA_16141
MFVFNYVEIVKEITDMLKKENEVHWTKEARESFSRIKEALQASPVLISPDYQNPFQVFSFASPNSIVVVLLHKNDEEKEQPVAFFSKILRDVELKYNILEKQDVVVHSDVEGKRGKWIAKIQEYDFDIKPTKLVKGQVLAKMLTKSNFQALGINLLTPVNEEIIEEGEEKSDSKDEFTETIKDYHEKLCGGQYSWKATAHKNLWAGFYWPTLFGDTYKFVKSYQKCQLFAENKRLAPFPLILVFIDEPFRQWGLDFVGEINPPSSGQHKWVLIATVYFTKWVEAIPTKRENDQVVMKFLEENILSRFGCPVKIITNNAQVFNSSNFIAFCQKYNVILSHSTTYHP